MSKIFFKPEIGMWVMKDKFGGVVKSTDRNDPRFAKLQAGPEDSDWISMDKSDPEEDALESEGLLDPDRKNDEKLREPRRKIEKGGVYAVVGSRRWDDKGRIFKILDEENKLNGITKLVSGGAKGADSHAKEWAIRNGIEYEEFPAQWDKNGMINIGAGMARNPDIIDAADNVIVFNKPDSPGSEDDIRLAEESGKPLNVYGYDDKENSVFAPEAPKIDKPTLEYIVDTVKDSRKQGGKEKKEIRGMVKAGAPGMAIPDPSVSEDTANALQIFAQSGKTIGQLKKQFPDVPLGSLQAAIKSVKEGRQVEVPPTPFEEVVPEDKRNQKWLSGKSFVSAAERRQREAEAANQPSLPDLNSDVYRGAPGGFKVEEPNKIDSAISKLTGRRVYHGTTMGTDFDKPEIARANTGAGGNEATQGNNVFYTTDSEAAAKFWSQEANKKIKQNGTNVMEFSVPDDAKVLNLTKAPTPEQMQRIIANTKVDAVNFPEREVPGLPPNYTTAMINPGILDRVRPVVNQLMNNEAPIGDYEEDPEAQVAPEDPMGQRAYLQEMLSGLTKNKTPAIEPEYPEYQPTAYEEGVMQGDSYFSKEPEPFPLEPDYLNNYAGISQRAGDFKPKRIPLLAHLDEPLPEPDTTNIEPAPSQPAVTPEEVQIQQQNLGEPMPVQEDMWDGIETLPQKPENNHKYATRALLLAGLGAAGVAYVKRDSIKKKIQEMMDPVTAEQKNYIMGMQSYNKDIPMRAYRDYLRTNGVLK